MSLLTPWTRALAFACLLLLPGCVGDAEEGLTVEQSSIQADTFQGVIHFQFTPTELPNKVSIKYDYEGDAMGVMLYRSSSVSGFWLLYGPNSEIIAVDGDAFSPPSRAEVGPPQSTGSGFSLEITASEYLDEPIDITFAVSSPEGDVPFILSATGGNVGPILHGSTHLYRTEDFSGALSVEAGDLATGATFQARRTLDFSTGQGTLVAAHFGHPLGPRVDSFTLSNSTTARKHEAVSLFEAGLSLATPGSEPRPYDLGLIAPPDEWTLEVEAAARKGALPVRVLVADVPFPVSAYFVAP